MRVNIFLRKPFELGNFSVEIFYKELVEELKGKINIKIIKVPFKNKGFIQRLLNILFCSLNQVEINHVVGDISYCTLLMNKKRLVLTILDCVSLHRYHGLKKSILKYFLFKIPILKSCKTVVISNSTKEDLYKLVGLNKLDFQVIPVTVSKTFYDLKYFSEIEKKENNFLIIGTAPNKNIERVAEALDGINCQLTIIGKLSNSQKSRLNNHKIKFKEIAKALSENQIIQEYKKSNLLIFCSELEGFGMPIIEANLIGVNILTSNISSMPFVASDSAIYVDPYSIGSIKKGVISFIKNRDLRNELRINGFKNAKRFNIKSIALKHLKLYQSI